jgi:hypothetical protein
VACRCAGRKPPRRHCPAACGCVRICVSACLGVSVSASVTGGQTMKASLVSKLSSHCLPDDLTPASSEAALGLQVEALQRFITRVTCHPVRSRQPCVSAARLMRGIASLPNLFSRFAFSKSRSHLFQALRKSTQVITFLSGSAQLLATVIAAPLPNRAFQLRLRYFSPTHSFFPRACRSFKKEVPIVARLSAVSRCQRPLLTITSLVTWNLTISLIAPNVICALCR